MAVFKILRKYVKNLKRKNEKMTDIIIYTTPEKLLHKRGKLKDDDDYSETGDYYWFLSKLPKKTEEGDKIFFATKGFIRGYFIIDKLDDEEGIIFNCKSWKNITPFPCIHFQGFKYADKVGELKDER